MKKPISILLIFLFSTHLSLLAQAEEVEPTLVAFSLNAWKTKYAPDGDIDIPLSEKVLPFNVVWAMYLDENNDIIIIGERTHTDLENEDICDHPFITLDQVITSLRSKEKLSDLNQNPGVSIESFTRAELDSLPASETKDRAKVRYAGDIEGTDFGRIALESDLILKLLGEGFILSGIEGVPRQIDLIIDNFKSFRLTDPIEGIANRSWFFPLKVLYEKDTIEHCISLKSIRIEVGTEYSPYLNWGKEEGTISITTEEIEQILDRDLLLATPLYATYLNQYLDSLRSSFPVLQELENIFALTGLFEELLEDGHFLNQQYWEQEYAITPVETPSTLPRLTNAENGLSYSYGISGGIFITSTDPWTKGMKSKYPEILKQSASASRPNEKTISWVLPTGFGSPEEWTDQLIDSLKFAEEKYVTALQAVYSERDCEGLLEIILSEPRPIDNPSYQTDTKGKDVFAFSGDLFISSEESEYSGYSRNWKVGTTDLKAGVNLNLNWVYDNKLSLGLSIPVVAKMQVNDLPVPNLPGITDIVIAVNGGVEVPTLTGKYLVYDGLDENNRWERPMVVALANFEIPVSFLAFDGYLAGKEAANKVDLKLPFGQDNFYITWGIETTMPFNLNRGNKKSYARLFTAYVFNLSREVRADQQLILDLTLMSPFKRPQNFYGGFRASTSFYPALVTPGLKVLGFMSIPERNGFNTFSFGWIFINKDFQFIRGGPVIQFNFSGHRLWDLRTWYR